MTGPVDARVAVAAYPDGWLLDGPDMTRLRDVCRQLFGDGSTLTPDRRRDLANLMHLVLDRAIPLRAD